MRGMGAEATPLLGAVAADTTGGEEVALGGAAVEAGA
jgi:hypothetical protein